MYHQTERSLDLQKRVSDFMDAHVFPNEQRYEEEIRANEKAGNAYTTVQLMEELKAKARAEGLWNLQLPPEHGGQGLGRVGMAVCYEAMNRSIFTSTPGPATCSPGAPRTSRTRRCRS